MSKIKRKMLMGDNWRFGEHESWFSDMAKEGWHLRKIGVLFAYFEQGDSKDIRYRIDTTANKKMSVEDKELFQEAGWRHITKLGEFNVFSSPVELEAPELHTDPAEQSYTLNELAKKIRKNTISMIAFNVLIIALIFFLWLFDSTRTLTFIEGDFVSIILLLTLASLDYTTLQANVSIRKLMESLQEGSSINHQAPWKRKRRKKFVIRGFQTVLFLVSISLFVVQIALEERKAFPIESDALPIVRLAEIERNLTVIREEHYEEELIDWLNRYTYKWSLVAPLQYASNEFWVGKNEAYSPNLRTRSYKLNFPSMKENLIADLMQKSSYMADAVEQKSDVFDILFIREKDEFKEVFASKGKGVIHVGYYGYADTATILEIVEEKLFLLENE